MVFERPSRPGNPKPSPATPKPNIDKPKKIITVGGSGGHRGTGGGDRSSHQPAEPSPWLKHKHEPGQPEPNSAASFVEYLRWMRPFDSPEKDGTKVQLLQLAEQKADYRDRLTQLTKRTKLIAGEENTFEVTCPWRIRVGGHRGPESILLPAFDALGMPYISSSTLRGVARTQAIREIMATREGVDRQAAEKQVEYYFGSLTADHPSHRTGKVIFLDAYPLPQASKSGGLAVDMANNIWKWDGHPLEYSPNPNPFFSLKQPTFLIGIRPGGGCDEEVLKQVRQWLIAGLQAGAGSQINTGYGRLLQNQQVDSSSEFFRVKFNLEGQLIHGRQKSQWKWHEKKQKWESKGQPEAEVRPVAFKSMLRYWFRTLALGVLPADDVKTWEATLFGGINPQKFGWVNVQILAGRVIQKEPQGKNDQCGQQEGILTLAYSSEAPPRAQDAIADLCKNLAWLMFHLGGIGQGARRPCYSRRNRIDPKPPWYRGSTLIPESEDAFWSLLDTVDSFRELFQQRLRTFYNALAQLPGINSINPNSPETVGQAIAHRWVEAADAKCRIVVVGGEGNNDKPYALDILHQKFHELEDQRHYIDAKSLCGGVKDDKYTVGGQEMIRKVTPSPVWIADLGDYQVVTVFGVTSDRPNPRKQYLQELRDHPSRQNYVQIWPFSGK